MINADQSLPKNKERSFLWISVLSLGVAIALARLNIYLGTQVNYLNYLLLFNALTISMLTCVGIAIILSIAGLWKTRFRNIPLMLMSLASSAFLILLFLIG